MASKMNNLTGKEWLQNSFSIWRDINKNAEERQLKHPAMFPEQLVERLINIYTKDPGEVILDPFMGIGTTVKAAYRLGKQGVGVELNKDYCEIAEKRIKTAQMELFNEDNGYLEPKIFHGDSRELDKYLDKESVDLVVTSPPYWDILNMRRTADNKKIRKYSESEKDIGNISDYDSFLIELKEIYQKVYDSLKPNKRCVCVVMDIRKKDKFYPLHEDQTRVMREVGFELEEYVIWDRQKEYNNMRTLGYPYVFRFNKVHEFICIYWKR